MVEKSIFEDQPEENSV